MVIFIIAHRLDNSVVCLNKDYIEAIEDETTRTNIKCSGIHYFVKETVEEILIQVDQLVEPHKEISRAVGIKPVCATAYEFKELVEKKPRKRRTRNENK